MAINLSPGALWLQKILFYYFFGGVTPVLCVRWAVSATDVLMLHRSCVMESSRICDGWSVNPRLYKCKCVWCHFLSFFFTSLKKKKSHHISCGASKSFPPLELCIIRDNLIDWRTLRIYTLLWSEVFVYSNVIPAASLLCVSSLSLFNAHFTVLFLYKDGAERASTNCHLSICAIWWGKLVFNVCM